MKSRFKRNSVTRNEKFSLRIATTRKKSGRKNFEIFLNLISYSCFCTVLQDLLEDCEKLKEKLFIFTKRLTTSFLLCIMFVLTLWDSPLSCSRRVLWYLQERLRFCNWNMQIVTAKKEEKFPVYEIKIYKWEIIFKIFMLQLKRDELRSNWCMRRFYKAF